MDAETTFRNLVKNHYMSDFNYADTAFSFRTVFELDTIFSYCLCRCGFDHEYLDYITDSGEIDENKFENIVKCVTDGHCPHVNDVPQDFVKETKVYGIHIAVAVGTREALADGLSKPLTSYGSLYHLDSYAIAILKNSNDEETISVVRKCFREKEDYQIDLVSAEKSNDDPNVITFIKEKVLDFLSRKKNIKLLESCLNTPGDYKPLKIRMEDTFRHSLKHDFEDIQERLTTDLSHDTLHESINHADLWIIYYDQAKLLDRLLGSAKRPLDEETHYQFTGLNLICDLLRAEECQKMMLKHGFSPMVQNLSGQEKVEKLLILLFLSPAMLKDKIIPMLKQIPNLRDTVKDETKEEQTWHYIQAYTTTNKNIPEILRVILDCGVDLNVTDLYGCCVTPLTEILMKLIANYPMHDEIRDMLTIRQTIELYLFENLDTETNEDAVALGLNADERLNKVDSSNLVYDINFHLTGTFQMDGEMNSLFGHHDEDDFALNFNVPLFLESGFAFQDFGRFASTAHGTTQELLEKVMIIMIFCPS